MDFKKLAIIGIAIVGLLTLVALIFSSNWIGLGILVILLIIFALLVKNEFNEDLVELEKRDIKRVSKSNPHKFTELYCISNSEIGVNVSRSIGKVLGHMLYGERKDHVFILKDGLFGEKIILVPHELIYNPTKKPLEGKVLVKSSGFISTGVFEVPDSTQEKYIENANRAFTKQVDLRGMVQVQKATMKLIKNSSGTDGQFLKKYAIERQEHFDASKQ